MYEICVISDFSSAHNLRNYKGKCENIHGHNWKVEVTAGSKGLNSQGMAVDFKDMKKALRAVTDELDHKNLNNILHFKKINPTSENIARYIYDRLCVQNMKSKTAGLTIKAVKVWESETAYAVYSK